MTIKVPNPTPDGKMPGESRCSPREIQNYLGRISAPLLDRIDLHIEVPQVPFQEISGERTGETSAAIRGRVMAARTRQQARFAHKPRITCNARMGSRELKDHCALDTTTQDFLKLAAFAHPAIPRVPAVANCCRGGWLVGIHCGRPWLLVLSESCPNVPSARLWRITAFPSGSRITAA
jgi:hypothetical protein